MTPTAPRMPASLLACLSAICLVAVSNAHGLQEDDLWGDVQEPAVTNSESSAEAADDPPLAVAAACPEPSLAPAIRQVPDRNQSPIDIRAFSFDAGQFETGYAQGEVELFRADQYLKTDALQFDPVAQTVTVTSPLTYSDAQIYLDAEDAHIDLANEAGEFNGIDWGIVGSTANGSANVVRFSDGNTSQMTGVAFTTCPGEQPEWLLQARELELRHDEGVGYARGATLRLGRVPVLYAPWMTFPIDDRRKSGFLYPRFGNTNDNGLELAVPWYWNIRPNMDATITPRYYTDRGFAVTGEYRFLTRSTGGSFNADWLPNDRLLKESRYHYVARFATAINSRWQADGAFDRVSDEEFFQDFGGSLASTSRQYLRSHIGISGAGRYWIFSMLADDFQVLDQSVSMENEPYRRLPRALFQLEAPLGRSGLQFDLDAEAVYFDRADSVTGGRLDVFPSVGFNLNRYWGFLRANAGYRWTTYSLDLLKPGDDSPSRGTSIVSVDTGMFFERMSEEGDVITLEPRLFYLHVPFKDQNDLPDFDTAEFTFGFAQLFHTNRFTGADRQSDANQLTLGLSTRSISATSGREIWNLNLGQIVYFEPPQVTIDDTMPTDLDTSPFIAELNWSPLAQLFTRVGLQWDWEQNQFDVASFATGYTSSGGHRVAFEYRFRRDELDQFDIRYYWPINERWRVFTRVNYSLENSRLLEAIGGVEYESCCWAVRFAARRHLKNRQGDTRDAFYVELRLKGMGSVGRRPPPLFHDPAP